MKPISPAQVLGGLLALAAGGFGLVQVIVGFVDGTISLSPLTSGYDPGTSYWGVLVQAAARAVGFLAATLAIVSLAARSAGTARAAGGVALLAVALGVAGEVAIVVGASGYRYEVTNDLVVGWIWGYLGLAALAVSGVALLLSGARRSPRPHPTTTPATSGASAPPRTPSSSPSTTTSAYFIEVDGVEYGPFSADDVRAFVDEGRIVADTLIRPEAGHYEPARLVPGLIPGI